LGALDAVEIDPTNLNSDIHGSAEYRANLVKVMAKRAVEALA
jgi:aerobic carbon-monoxide dehydrogenase medium subunit